MPQASEFNNQVGNSQAQGNEKIPAKTGAIPENTNIRPVRVVTTAYEYQTINLTRTKVSAVS